MKRTVASIVTLCIFLTLSVTAFGADSKIIAQDVTCKNHRLFTIYIGLDTNESLTAGSFYIEYDKSCMEFRSADEAIPNSQVEFSEQSDRVKIIFLCHKPVKAADCKKLFSLKFKSKSPRKSKVKISCDDLVNKDVESLSSPKSTRCTVTITGIKSSSVTSNHHSKISDNTKATDDNKSSKTETLANSNNNSVKILSQQKFPIIPIIIGVAIVSTTVVVAFYMNRKAAGRANKPEKTE